MGTGKYRQPYNLSRLSCNSVRNSARMILYLMVALPNYDGSRKVQAALQLEAPQLQLCQEQCKFSLVESIPEGMHFPNGTATNPSTFSVWLDLLAKAQSTVEIGAFYLSLQDGRIGKYPSGGQGQQVFDELLLAGTKRGLTVKIAQNQPTSGQPYTDYKQLIQENAAEVRALNFTRLLEGGILHSKLWLVDRRHFYIGSANPDWRALTQIKELGVYVQDCPCLAEDAGKLFDVYWMLGAPDAQVPDKWPDSLPTAYNDNTAMNLSTLGQVYLSSAPPAFCPPGRTDDGNAITSAIARANKFVYVSVTNYFPLYMFLGKPKYWGVIDDALRTAAVDRGVNVRLLVNWKKHFKPNKKAFLRSLAELSDGSTVNLTVKLFVVPSTAEQSKIRFARMKHGKFMVTENTALIGTSNWSADYFTKTAGLAVVVQGQTILRQQLEDLFIRDWNSEYAHNLP